MNQNHDISQLGPSPRLIYDELIKRHIVCTIYAGTSLFEYIDTKGNKRLLNGVESDKVSAIGASIARSKHRTALVAEGIGIKTPQHIVCSTFEQALDFLKEYKTIVIKPVDGFGGHGVTVAITNLQTLYKAYHYAQERSQNVIAQQYVIGSDIRALIINGVFVSAVERIPAQVIGDGILSVEELILKENKDPVRNNPTLSSLEYISREDARRYLGKKMEDILENGKHYRVVGPANVSLGGTLHEFTDTISNSIKKDAELIAQKLKLDLCGVDIIWDQEKNDHYLIEVNSKPALDIHDDPLSGTSSNAVQKYVDWLLS